MKKITAIVLIICMSLTLCSCYEEKTYDISEYILELEYKEDFRILQLNDIHLGNKDNRQKHYDFMNLTIKDADADLIILNGDLFTYADKAVAKELFSWIDSYNTPWTVTFGNHDEQCYFSIDWLTNYLNNFGSNCIFKDIQGDDVYGNANFAINLTKDGSIHDQIIIMDSNRYDYGDYWGYDYIKQNQIDWYEKLVNYTKDSNNGKTVSSLLFFHIPVPEFQDAWDEAQAGSSDAVLEYGEKNEDVSSPKFNSGMFDKVIELNSGRLISCAHDHINNYRILYKGIYLAYGVNSNDRIYCQNDMMGGMVVVIHNDNSLDFEYIYHTYDEVTE